MTIQRALSEIELADLEEAAYQEMLDHYHGEWFAITNGRLYHSPDRDSVESQLAGDGVDRRSVLVTRMPPGPPYLVIGPLTLD